MILYNALFGTAASTISTIALLVALFGLGQKVRRLAQGTYQLSNDAFVTSVLVHVIIHLSFVTFLRTRGIVVGDPFWTTYITVWSQLLRLHVVLTIVAHELRGRQIATKYGLLGNGDKVVIDNAIGGEDAR